MRRQIVQIERDGKAGPMWRSLLADALQADEDHLFGLHVDVALPRPLLLQMPVSTDVVDVLFWRNGPYHGEREVLTAAGAVTVRAPRVNDKRVDPETGERQRFSSAILPAWARKSPQMTEVLPLLYLHGLSSGDFAPALEQFLGTAAGLSASAITRLTSQWQDGARPFTERDLSGVDYV